ncbi:MAG: hypothetical protein LBT87_07235, partial [Treponema sp.]|nr:hypothetical protein [Treponema sp.]
MSAAILTVNALEQSEEYFLFAGITRERREGREGKAMDDETVKRLFTLDGTLVHESPAAADSGISAPLDQKERAVLRMVSQRNAGYFENDADKLDGWAEDL